MDSEPVTEVEAVLDISNNRAVKVLKQHGYLSGKIEPGVSGSGLTVYEDKETGDINIRRDGPVKERMSLHARDSARGCMFSRLLRTNEKLTGSSRINKEEVVLDISTDPIGKRKIDPPFVTFHLNSANYRPEKVWHERLYDEKTSLLVDADVKGVITRICLDIYDSSGKLDVSANCDPRNGGVVVEMGTLDESQFRKHISEATSYNEPGLPKSIRLGETIKGLTDFTEPNKPIGKRIVLK